MTGISPETWYTEPQAASLLMVEEEALKRARYRKKVKSRKLCGVVQYKGCWLIEFREGTCEESQDLSNVTTLPTGSYMYPQKEVSERAALARAKQIIARQSVSSRNGSSKDENRNSHPPKKSG